MKNFILVLSFVVLCLSDATAKDAAPSKGEIIFKEKSCVLCHKKGADTIGPALMTIAKAYLGKEASLFDYLKGQGKPIVEPLRAPFMNPQLLKIRTLSDEDMKAVATYIISSSDRPL